MTWRPIIAMAAACFACAAALPSAGAQPAGGVEDDRRFFARISEVSDFVRLADRDRKGFANVTGPRVLDGDYHLELPQTGTAVLELPGGARIRVDPGASLSWIDEEVVLERGFFEVSAPTLFHLRYPGGQSQQNLKGTGRLARITKTLDACENFFQATRRTRFQVLLSPGRAPLVQVLEGDLRQGHRLILQREGKADLTGLPADLRPPEPLLPFPGHEFTLPIDEMAFVVDTLPGRAWDFEFSRDEKFTEIFCRVRSPKNTINLPPFSPGPYYWRICRINEEGLRTPFSHPVGFKMK